MWLWSLSWSDGDPSIKRTVAARLALVARLVIVVGWTATTRSEGTCASVIRHTNEFGAHTRARRVVSFVGGLALWVVVAFCAWILWPSTLGGATTFIIVSGHSMEPDYRPGDLLVARTGEPAIGDVVVYQPGAQYGNAKVVHQIIGGDGVSGWEIQGTNNDFVDQWRPTNDQVVGIVQVHFPSLGALGVVLLSPYLWGAVLVIAIALMLWPEKDDDDDAEAAKVAAAAVLGVGSR
jgi:signal peptidase